MKNNELFQQGDTAWLAQYQFTNVVEQVEFLYAPTSCEQLGKMPNQKCLKDIGIVHEFASTKSLSLQQTLQEGKEWIPVVSLLYLHADMATNRARMWTVLLISKKDI